MSVKLKRLLSKSPEYRAWENAKQRCTNPLAPNYAHYGGRGITVCKRWSDSFEAFYEDMGARPAGLTLDRIDVNGDYEPSNCQWTSQRRQVMNRRSSKTDMHHIIPKKFVTEPQIRYFLRIDVRKDHIVSKTFKSLDEAKALRDSVLARLERGEKVEPIRGVSHRPWSIKAELKELEQP